MAAIDRRATITAAQVRGLRAQLARLPSSGGGTPSAHASSHEDGGSDALDVTTLDGFPGGTTDFLRADGTFAAVPGAGGSHASSHETGGGDPLSALSAAILTSGTVPDARLSTNVQMKPIGAADLPSPLTLTGGQIAFPATQSPSANVNTLDDYEEGTWTPYWAGSGGQSGQTYLAQDGSYTKIGNRVFATGRIVLAVLGTITGNALVAGLPFQASGSFYAVGTLTVTFVANLGAAVSLISGQVGQGGYYADMYYVPAAGGTSFTAVTATQMTSNLDLYFHVSYQASA